MLKKNKSFFWSDEAEAAFVEIKTCMASHPILITPNFEKQFYIACDASDRAIAGCLFKVINQFEHPICYISQKLNCHQKANSTIEKETLSLLIIAIPRFRIYFGNEPRNDGESKRELETEREIGRKRNWRGC